MATKSIPLTVESVRQFALPTGADFVVLLAYFDPAHTEYLTWGREPEDKVTASDLSEEISAWINSGACKSMLPSQEPATVFESFKLDAAKNKAEVDRLRDAIRAHRDERGDDRCHADDGRLYAVLPEGDTRPERETAVTLANCAKYIECRQTGREYVSPQRRIEELEVELTKLREATQAAYWHLDTYGAVQSHEDELASQQRVFDLLRPFCPPIPGRL